MNAPIAAAKFGSGHTVRRIEDPTLITGRGQYADDITLPGQTHLVFLRSPYAHARITSVDTSAAAGMSGVLAVYTGAQLMAAGVKALPAPAPFPRPDGTPGTSAPRRALAHQRVRYVGEAVVAVVAESIEQARAACDAVLVDYDELPAVTNVFAAMRPGAPQLCDDAPDNIAAAMRHGDVAACAAAFAAAAHTVSVDVDNQRLAASPIEPRCCNAALGAPGAPDAGRLVVRLSSQMPTGVRNSLVDAIPGLTTETVRVLVGDVGGGFGMKTGIYPEDLTIVFCARALQRPVKWVADRSEEFISATHGRDLQTQAELALDASGKILALRVASLANVGAYPTGTGAAIQLRIGPWVQTSVYDIQTIDFHFKAVLTNTSPTAAYRGAGRPEAIHIMERLMDEAARQSGIDRIALRRRNFIAPSQMPYQNPMGQIYDCGHFESIMDQALVLADWSGFAARAADSARRGMLRGQGIATFLEWTGGNAMEETVTVAVQADGMIEVFSAVNGMGQGILTSLAQLVVDAFGVPIEKVRVVLGDTDRGDGFGSAGSRSIFTGGSAIRVGADQTIAEAKRLAALEFEASVQDIEYRNGCLQVIGTDLSIDIFALARRQADQRIFMNSTTSASGPSWPNGCHISEVEIDPLTGHVAVAAYASVNDVGRVVNPMIVRGQLDGGAVQGIGQALYEHLIYDRETGQPLTGSLMDYVAPRADDSPVFKTEMDSSVPCLNNALGVKGVGELGTIGATPTVVNAVADALSRAGMVAKAPLLQMPLSSARVWALMQS